jgi:HSP20 family molecular chaperone IbpA
MTITTPWDYKDPFDIVWKNLFDHTSKFNTVINNKINYPVDIYETEKGLRLELAVVGLDEKDIDIQVESDILRIKHEKSEDTVPSEAYYHKGIAKRSFDLAWKISSKVDLNQLEAVLDKGLLIIDIPYVADKISKKIEIKSSKQILKG